MRARRCCLVALPALILGPTVSAHVANPSAAGLVSGLLHPIAGLDHVVAMVAVGLWGAQLGSPSLWLLPVAFPMVMAVGGALGLIGIPLPGVEFAIALSGLALGAAVAAEWRPSPGIAAAVVGVFALFHGHAHGVELPQGESGLVYSIGFVVSTGLLHASGIGLGAMHRWTRGRLLVRAWGGVIALVGLGFLWSALR